MKVATTACIKSPRLKRLLVFLDDLQEKKVCWNWMPEFMGLSHDAVRGDFYRLVEKGLVVVLAESPDSSTTYFELKAEPPRECRLNKAAQCIGGEKDSACPQYNGICTTSGEDCLFESVGKWYFTIEKEQDNQRPKSKSALGADNPDFQHQTINSQH